jgi:hypothetical protein
MKRVEDLPHFLVTGIKKGKSHDTGQADFELSGVFDKVDGVSEGRAWLLLPERDCLIGDLESLDLVAKTAVYRTALDTEPHVIGSKLPYLDGYWQAYHVWMVLEPRWTWKPVLFQARDAIGRKFQEQVQMIDGPESKEWIEIKELAGQGGKRRYYPVGPERPTAFSINADGIVASGWDHEHCELCNTHIEPGVQAYVDPSEHWVCKGCYTKYVLPHDLSFIGTL